MMDAVHLRELGAHLVQTRASLVYQQPFFARLLMHLPFGFAPCETAYTDMQKIVFDPAFVQRLDERGRAFVMLHELMHCVLKHCTRSRGKLHLLYNIACDIVVNSMILDAWNLTEFEIDGSPMMHTAPDGKEGRVYTADEVYEMLLKNSETQLADLFGVGNRKKGKGAQKPSGDATRDAYAQLEQLYDDNKIDNHDAWENIGNTTFAENVWDTHIKQAAEESKQAGNIPACMERVVRATVHTPKIAWQQVLHDYIQSFCSDYVFSVPDRRFSGDIILPSFQENVYGARVEDIWFAVDTSGSIDDDQLAEAFGEIKDAVEQMDNIEGKVSFFDCEITDPVPFSSVEDIEQMIPKGGGGTSFEVIFSYLAEHMAQALPKVLVIITDGYADFPPEDAALGVPVIWLIVDSDVTPPFGEVLYLTSN